MLVGTRVGALSHIESEGDVFIYGIGTLLADAVPPADGLGLCVLLAERGRPVPAIQLDEGPIVYGPECYWGELEVYEAVLTKAREAGRSITAIDLLYERAHNTRDQGPVPKPEGLDEPA